MSHVKATRSRVISPFESYLREIHETKLLDAQTERDLAWRIGAGDITARDHMVQANLRLVVRIARNYLHRGLPLEELIAEGNLGLFDAATHFDPTRGVRFSTYAVYWIKQAIRSSLVKTSKMVRLPSYMAHLLVRWKRAAADLQAELNRPPTPEEVGTRLGLSGKKLNVVNKALSISGGTLPQEREDGRHCPGEIPSKGEAPDTRLAQMEEVNHVLRLVEGMDAREAAVLRLRFGLTGEPPMTLEQIGNRLGLTRERVRQIERDGLVELREHLEGT